MKIRKIIYMIATAVVVIMLSSGYGINKSKASEYTYTSGDYEYDFLDDGTIEITDYTGSDTEIEIPSTIDGYTVTSIGSGAFEFCSGLTSITIPSGVTSIGSWTFRECSKLTSITIPYGVTSIGNAAFMNCKSLTNITIPYGVTSIKDDTFAGCTKLTSIDIPDSVVSIGDYVFEDCTSLASIYIPDSVTSIGCDLLDGTAFYNDESNWEKAILYINNWLIEAKEDEIAKSYTIKAGTIGIARDAFYGCKGLTKLEIPDSVKYICSQAFEYCTSLTSVIIPDGVTAIEEYTFYKCTVLASIYIPNSVTSIGDRAFSGCTTLSNIYFDGSKKQWETLTFGEYWNGSCPSYMVIHCTDGDIPITVTKGKVYTEGNYKYKVTKVSAGSNGTVTVTKIVTKKASVKIPATITINGNKYKVTAIAKNAFKGNTKMTSLVISSNVKTIGANAFCGCTKLKKVTIGKNVTTIGAKAFYNCKKLSKVTIRSKKLTSSKIGSKAFSKTMSTVKIKVPKAKKSAYKKLLLDKGFNKKAKISASKKLI